MNKSKTKRGQSRTGWWLIERIFLFITVVWMFVFNLLSLAIPVNLITHSTGAEAIAVLTLVTLSMLFTFLAAHLYYRLVRWLSTKQPGVALVYLVWSVIGFFVLCVLMAAIFGGAPVMLSTGFPIYFPETTLLPLVATFVSPQLAIITIWTVLVAGLRVRRHSLSVSGDTQDTLTLP
jgi:hypothetical protein